MELGLNRACGLVCIYEGVDQKVLDSVAHIYFEYLAKLLSLFPLGLAAVMFAWMPQAHSWLAAWTVLVLSS